MKAMLEKRSKDTINILVKMNQYFWTKSHNLNLWITFFFVLYVFCSKNNNQKYKNI